MKKTIRLTESELVKVVQRIIKEDEMMGGDMTSSMSTPPSGCRTTIGKLAKQNPSTSNLPGNAKFVVSEITGKAMLTKMAVGMDSIEEPIKVGTVISPRLTIKLANGTKILFNDIPGFGQATIECNNNKATMSVSWE